MTEAGWTHGKDLSAEEQSFMASVKVLIDAIEQEAYHQGRVAGLREAAEMVEDDCYIEGGELLPDYKHRCKHNVNQKELAGKIRFRANDLAQQAQEVQLTKEDNHG